MFMCQEQIIDYQVIAIDQVLKYLEQGFYLYGSVFLSTHHQGKPTLYQAVVKPSPRLTLTRQQARCVTLLASGLTEQQVAGRLLISRRAVSDIFHRLRQKFSCHTTAQLMAKLYQSSCVMRHDEG